jgi:hypothetical protein
MDARTAAKATATAVSTIGSHFMLDGKTYARGAELGFTGLDFYVTGRGGVLGDVDADVVSAAFAFFEPAGVRSLWDAGKAVMPPSEAAEQFAACAAAWAEEHVPDDFDAARLATLAGQVVAGARPACAAVFCGWRALEVPSAPKAAAVHQMNALRELRHGLHAAAIIATGLTPIEALSVKTPQMAPIFGWPGPIEVTADQTATWEQAEAATTTAIAHAYESLSDDERTELTDLARTLHTATS